MKNFFDLNFQNRWGTFSIYEKFEHLIISLLTAIIAALVGAATWQLILHTFALVRSWSARLEMCQWMRENWTRRAYGTRQEVPA